MRSWMWSRRRRPWWGRRAWWSRRRRWWFPRRQHHGGKLKRSRAFGSWTAWAVSVEQFLQRFAKSHSLYHPQLDSKGLPRTIPQLT